MTKFDKGKNSSNFFFQTLKRIEQQTLEKAACLSEKLIVIS
jgi:hypothetical protein